MQNLEEFADLNRKRIIVTREPKGDSEDQESYSCVLEDAFLRSGSTFVPLFGQGSSEFDAKLDLCEKIKNQTIFFCSPGDLFSPKNGVKAPSHLLTPLAA